MGEYNGKDGKKVECTDVGAEYNIKAVADSVNGIENASKIQIDYSIKSKQMKPGNNFA